MTTRRYDLDWIRIAAFGALILYHTGMYYVTWDYHVKSPFASDALEPLMMLTSPWRLNVLFLVSGAATGFLYHRQPGRFLRSRSVRLLLPLIFGMLVVVPPQSYYQVVEQLGYADGYLAFWKRYLLADHSFCKGGDCLRLPTWNHLWFVAYLWAYTVVAWVGLRFVTWRPRLRWLDGGWLLAGPILVLVALRLTLFPRFPSTHAFGDDWYNHAQYLFVFLLGLAIARHDELWERFARQRWLALALWAATYGFLIWYFNFAPYTDELPPPDGLRDLQRVVFAANQWAAVSAVVGWFVQLRPGDSPARRTLTEAVFPVYILHQTIIIAVAMWLRPLGWRPPLEGPIVVLATALGCWGGYLLIRRVRWLRPLFGLRFHEVAKIGCTDLVRTLSSEP